jgi:cadmium resistance protein CadD (predicted permease)
MRWRERRQGHWFGAAILIAVGVIGLLENFHLLPRDILDQLWKLWPLIPLAIGISILVRRRQYDEAQPPPDAKKN